MKLPEIQNPEKYTGLYIVDFGDHTGVGFRAEEVAALLEEQKEIRIYKIYRAQPDGTMEIRGVDPKVFELESGLFFFETDEDIAREEYERLIALAGEVAPPARAKAHLSVWNDGYVIALIYPAEYDQEFSRWLLDIGYTTQGAVEGGISAVQGYYDGRAVVLQQQQLFGLRQQILAGEELKEAARRVLVR